MIEKICTRCSVLKSADGFSADKRKPGGLKSWCKACARAYYSENSAVIIARQLANSKKPEVAERLKKYNEEYKPRARAKKLEKAYKISIDQYNQLLTAQSNRCAICDRHESEFKRRLFVDHDHKTGLVRGLLCFGCNSGIGHLQDSPEVIDRAAAYLRK